MNAAEALAQVQAIIQQRGEHYGNVRENMAETAKRMSLTMGYTVTPESVCLLMIDLKLARLKETPGHLDSVLDVMGYAALLAELITD
jgi:hypothetical protein